MSIVNTNKSQLWQLVVPLKTRGASGKVLGRFEMRLETTGRKELVQWIPSRMPDVKVLEPESLQNRIAEKLRDGLRAQE